MTVTSREFAQWVAVDVPGFQADDSWFHLEPGGRHTVELRGDPDRRPRGDVRAVNARVPSSIVVEEGA